MHVIHIKYIIVNFMFSFNLIKVNGLVELASVNDNLIITMEAAIRDTINKLFHVFKLKEIKNNPKLKQYSMVHNSLVAIMLQDNDNLKTIGKLARVNNNIDNTTENFMGAINELLAADENTLNINENNENVMDAYVIKYIDSFLSQLKGFKSKFGVLHSNSTLDINEELVTILTEDVNSNINVTSPNYSNISYDIENNDILGENDFWQPSGRRIYRGQQIKIKYFPFMASVQIFHKFHCSGSIVKSDLVITAASCLQLAWNNRFFRENPAFLSVRVGSSFHNGGGELVPVLEVYFHPGYNPKNLRHNLCFLRLIRHLKMKKRVRRVKRIAFDKSPHNLPETTPGITVLGWGAREASNILHFTMQSKLAFSVLDIYPWRECAEVYSKEYVTKNNFCAGFFSKGGGACNRDVGGPGIVDGLLSGVISFGSPTCGTPDAPTVFTKLGYYVDWIEEIMEQVVPRKKTRTTSMYRPLYFVTETREPTTFTFPPLEIKTTQRTPDLNLDLETLRLLKDENLFQEFIGTMFGSKEVSSVDFQAEENATDDATSDEILPSTPKKKNKSKHKTEKGVEFVTKIFGFDDKVTKSYSNNKFTVLEPNLSDIAENELERDIAKLIDGIPLNRGDVNVTGNTSTDNASASNESLLGNRELNDSPLAYRESSDSPLAKRESSNAPLATRESSDNTHESENIHSSVEESVESDGLQLVETQGYSKSSFLKQSKAKSVNSVNDLFQSEERSYKNKNIDQSDGDENGLSIETDEFQDLTLRQEVEKVLFNFIPKEELYKILMSTINSNVKNKKR